MSMHSTFAHAFEVPLRLAFAVVSGASIGLNRWFHHKPAGIGTHGLVALGAALASIIAANTPGADAASASRVIQGLVTGVGFIGAGVIMRENQGQQVHGLTTAASIWASSILGIACGISNFAVAATGLVFALIILFASKPLEEMMERIVRHREERKLIDPGGHSE
jgi:putative Mg2+ transporter-C (MgtC) family protein